MGYSRSSDEDRSLHTAQVELQGRAVGRNLCGRGRASARCTVRHYVRQRSEVYFTFLGALQEALGTKMKLSFAYHPQTDGQTERTIQSLEDLLRACVLDHKGSWDKLLPLIEFTYNNSFHASIGMSPYEALFGRRCRTPLCWHHDGENLFIGPEVVE